MEFVKQLEVNIFTWKRYGQNHVISLYMYMEHMWLKSCYFTMHIQTHEPTMTEIQYTVFFSWQLD